MKKFFSLFSAMMMCCSMHADTGLVTWDTPFVENVVAWCNGDGTVAHENNSKDGITVTFDGDERQRRNNIYQGHLSNCLHNK